MKKNHGGMRLKLLDARIIFGEVFWYYFQILSNQTRNLRLSHPHDLSCECAREFQSELGFGISLEKDSSPYLN